MKTLKKIIDCVLTVILGKSNTTDEMVALGLVDFSGCGRDKFGN